MTHRILFIGFILAAHHVHAAGEGVSPYLAGRYRARSQAARKRRSRRLFVTTETLESDIAALAMIGESSHPVIG